MRASFVIGADPREMQGKGASRRLRHKGKVPAILYGGHQEIGGAKYRLLRGRRVVDRG